MDPITHCPKCGKRRVPVVTLFGSTDLQCIGCDDPAVKWAESAPMASEKPIVAVRLVAGQASGADTVLRQGNR
jgi:hypothetical protein